MKKIFLILAILLISNSLISSWKQVFFLDQAEFQSISCPDSNNCFAIMNHPSTPVLYKSIDQGRTWVLIFEDNKKINPSVEESFALDSSHYYIADYYYSTLRKSSNGGRTFKEIVLDDTHFGAKWTLRNLVMYNSNIGFVANGYNYFTTKDGWESFSKHNKKNSLETLYSPFIIDSNVLVMAYSSSENPNGMACVKYYLNENKWDTISYLGFDEGFEPDSKFYRRLYSIFFINDTIGFGCGSLLTEINVDNYFDMIYKTTDGGYNWNTVLKEYMYPQIGFTNNISFTDERNGIAVGHYGKIAMTNDGGDSWVYEPTPNEMDHCLKMQVCWAGHTPLIGTWDAGIFRYEGDFFKFPEDTTGVEERENYSSGSFNLSIYQKKGKLYISLEDEKFRKYKLQIYDILGNIVQEEELQSGIGTLYIPYDISHLINGTYLWSISTAGVVAKTGKTIIMENVEEF